VSYFEHKYWTGPVLWTLRSASTMPLTSCQNGKRPQPQIRKEQNFVPHISISFFQFPSFQYSNRLASCHLLLWSRQRKIHHAIWICIQSLQDGHVINSTEFAVRCIGLHESDDNVDEVCYICVMCKRSVVTERIFLVALSLKLWKTKQLLEYWKWIGLLCSRK
jgi:hypothetical protein